ncbi:hypothetical protein JGS39_21030, partial [Streptomyces sp. P01-B04]|nr:hypothetical protein [Streptomyces poriferorum]
MSDVDGSGGERTGSTPRPGASASNGAQAAPAVPGPESRDTAVAAESAAEKPAREKSGSDWFAPRKSPAAGPAGASAPSGTPPNDGTDGAGFRAGGPEGPGGTDGAGFRAGGPEGPGGTDGAGFAAGGSGSRPDGPGSGPSSPPPGGPRADLPYFSDGPQRAGDPGAPGSDAFGGDGAGGPRSTPNLGVRTPGPSGPTTGPATGTSALTPDLDGRAPFGPGPGGPGPNG